MGKSKLPLEKMKLTPIPSEYFLNRDKDKNILTETSIELFRPIVHL